MRKVDMIIKVWGEIPGIIKRTFLKYCISNNMDVTEDNIWEEAAASRFRSG